MTGHRILVVEDAPDLALAISLELEDELFVVRLAHTGAEAREQIARELPDLAVLDMELPDTTGIALCQEIRRSHTIPVIIFSGVSAQTSVREVIQRGATDYVLKGSGLEELVARVKLHLRANSQQDEAPVAAAPQKSPQPADLRLGVLVVESDPASRAELAKLLAGAGFRAVPAATAPEALELVRTALPKVVVVALDSPGTGGLKLVKEIRELKTGSRPGIVSVSRKMSPEAVRRAKYHGVSAFITRPWNASRVHLEISQALDAALRASGRAA